MHFEERDFFENRFLKKELVNLIGNEPPSKLFSWKSPSVKKLGLKQESINEDQLISLMIEEPRLIRRPLITIGKNLVYGRDSTTLSALLYIQNSVDTITVI